MPSSGITFRHDQNPSLNANEGNLKSFYGYKETFRKETIWLDVPRQLTFINTTNPYEDAEAERQSQQRKTGPGLLTYR